LGRKKRKREEHSLLAGNQLAKNRRWELRSFRGGKGRGEVGRRGSGKYELPGRESALQVLLVLTDHFDFPRGGKKTRSGALTFTGRNVSSSLLIYLEVDIFVRGGVDVGGRNYHRHLPERGKAPRSRRV